MSDLGDALAAYDAAWAASQAAMDDLVAAFDEYRRINWDLRRRVGEGEAADLVLQSNGGGEQRVAIDDALEGFGRTRDTLRTAIIDLGVQQGRSISEMGRRMGISRQYAARLAAARKRADPPPEGTPA
jgi:hypothetical protein